MHSSSNEHFNESIAVIIPCKNEERSIRDVVSAFHIELPEAKIYVFDNSSTDSTALEAKKAGAIVRTVNLPGKGNVVRRMFADVPASIYLLVDGDGTYDPTSCHKMIDLIRGGNDMVVGVRKETSSSAYRSYHIMGNRFFTWVLNDLFSSQLSDVFSGYRAFSNRFIRSFPAHSRGFEVETELSVFAIEQRMPIAEIDVKHSSRLSGSSSKLNTFTDGFKIAFYILVLVKEIKPLSLFGLMSLFSNGAALICFLCAATCWENFEYISSLMFVITGTGGIILGFVLVISGVILNTLAVMRKSTSHQFYKLS